MDKSFIKGFIKYLIPRRYKALKPGLYTASIEEVIVHRNGNVSITLKEIKRQEISHTLES